MAAYTQTHDNNYDEKYVLCSPPLKCNDIHKLTKPLAQLHICITTNIAPKQSIHHKKFHKTNFKHHLTIPKSAMVSAWGL